MIYIFTLKYLCTISQVFPNEMPVFLREHDSGAYRVSSYFFGRTVVSERRILFECFLPIIGYLYYVKWLDCLGFFLHAGCALDRVAICKDRINCSPIP